MLACFPGYNLTRRSATYWLALPLVSSVTSVGYIAQAHPCRGGGNATTHSALGHQVSFITPENASWTYPQANVMVVVPQRGLPLLR